jgi:hypothetical protein
MKPSSDTSHASDADGKNAHLFSVPNRLEPSYRPVAVKM